MTRSLTMSKKSDTVKYKFTHLKKILKEKYGWISFPLVTKSSIITTEWEGEPIKQLKI